MISGKHRNHLGAFKAISYQVNRWQANQINIQYGIWIVDKQWVGNGLLILGRCWKTHTKPLVSAAVGPLQCTGYVICDRLQSPAVAIVAMNPRSLWTPLLWGRGSFVSCTVCAFTLNNQWRQPLLHPGGHLPGSIINGNVFPRASWGRATFGEASPIWITAMEMPLQCLHQQRHRQAPTNTRLRENPPPYNRLWALAFKSETTINTSTLFVERKSTSPWRSVSYLDAPPYNRLCQFRHNTETDSTTQDWDRETAYQNQWRFTWFELYLRYCCSMQYWSHTARLCVIFGGAVDWKSSPLKGRAKSTTELRKHERENGCLGGVQGMAWLGFCLLSSVCFLSVFQWLSDWQTWQCPEGVLDQVFVVYVITWRWVRAGGNYIVNISC